MRTTLNWQKGMVFTAQAEGHTIDMDAKSPIGSDSAMTPKELVAAGLGGCTAMDVVALLKKHKQELTNLAVDVEIGVTKGVQPVVFTDAEINFVVTGAVDRNILLEAVRLSQTKFCGVSAMLSKAFPIRYRVSLNGEAIGEGFASFGGT